MMRFIKNAGVLLKATLQAMFLLFVVTPLTVLAAFADSYSRKRLCLYGAPENIKELHEATEKAFKAMEENIKKSQDLASNALEEVRKEGTLHGKTNEELKKLGETGNALAANIKELRDRMQEVEQKAAHKPAATSSHGKSIGQLVTESEQFKAAGMTLKGKAEMQPVEVGSFHKTAIVNATGQNQPLVPSDRLQGIIIPELRRLTIRNLIPNNTTSSNLVEFAKETLFTNNAGPQGGATSPTVTGGEGEIKAESAITFELANTAVVTLAHFIPASRQVLADAPMLQGFIDGRLRYGLALKEEDELLNGAGTAGDLSGLVTNATAFTGGATNQTALDTLLKAFLQISLQNMEASGVVLHPTDWTNIMLLKDTTGRYLFSNPQEMAAPRVWGKDVIATASQTQGQFLAGAFTLAAEVFDRENATVRIAEQHADFFVRNMVAVLAEERLALAIYRSAAIVKGSISYAG
jgi:HK97 family phage major capsid protein